MAKKYNFNAIRPAIVEAHNNDNARAIDKKLLEKLNIDVSYLNQWVLDVKSLQGVVESWVDNAWNSKFDSAITDDVIQAAKERVYPKWKTILSCGEKEDVGKELHVTEFDVYALFKFAWDFKATGVGTTVAHMSNEKFRKYVESLLGCCIAKNGMLSDHDRDILDTYQKANRTITGCIDAQAEIDLSKKNYALIKADIPETEKMFLAHIDRKVKELEEQEKVIAERKSKAESELAKVSAEAQQIRNKLKYSNN